MIKENFVITKFVTAFFAEDARGRRAFFTNRRSACFILPVCGKISFSGEEGRVVADASHPVFLPEGFSYLNECLEDARSYVFNFKTAERYRRPRALGAVPHELCATLYEKIRQAEYAPSLQSTLDIFGSLYTLAARLFEESTAPAHHEAVEHALAYMRQHYARPRLTVAEIARAACVSEIYLRKLFARELSATPFQALTALRMQRASLLIEEKRPLAEIAASVGYSDLYQFSRAYKRHFGTPPSGKSKGNSVTE